MSICRRVERLVWARYGPDSAMLSLGGGRYEVLVVNNPNSPPPWATTVMLTGTLSHLERVLTPPKIQRDRDYAKHGGYAAYMQRRKQRKKEAGVCVECSEPATGGTIRCARHNQTRNDNRRKHR